MIKIGVITDAHANLPALTSVLEELANERCDTIIHTGDAIGIGPHPAEVLDMLLTTPNIQFLMGNHDDYFVNGPPPHMSAEELDHQRWTHRQLSAGHRAAVATWPLEIDMALQCVEIRFCHYPKSKLGDGYISIVKNPSASDLDAIFQPKSEKLIFYGHHHPQSDLTGLARYINPGALGCGAASTARFAVLEISDAGDWNVRLGETPYDRSTVYRDLEEREVPARELIRRAFYGIPT